MGRMGRWIPAKAGMTEGGCRNDGGGCRNDGRGRGLRDDEGGEGVGMMVGEDAGMTEGEGVGMMGGRGVYMAQWRRLRFWLYSIVETPKRGRVTVPEM